MRKMVLAALAIVLAGCSAPDSARRALDDAGFTEIEVTGWAPFAGCGENDTFVTRFKAKNAHGKRVSGVVCSGWFKGSTIRFD